jgi:LmbE family N-acetylglucosaminyl deacetylase
VTKRLAVVFAHPDDDTYGIAGSVAVQHDSDIKVTVVLATSGEAGRIFDESLATRATLASVREAEDRASWEEVGVTPAFHFLRYPDSALAAANREELVSRIEGVLVVARPDVVVTFGPDGVTAHEDHVTVGAAATEAFHRARARTDGGGVFQRLLHVGLRQSRIDRFNAWLLGHGMEPLDAAQAFTPRGVPDERFGVVVDCLPAYERKLEALRRHKTQGELEDIPYELWPELLGEEAFILAWPERLPGDPVLTDVFEGLRDA